MSNALEIGQQLCNYVREGKNAEAINALYADNVVSVEAAAMQGQDSREMSGKQAILGKNAWWENAHEVHSADIQGPYPHGNDRFAAIIKYDVTNKESGQRFNMEEVAVYHLDGGKISREEFFYTMG